VACEDALPGAALALQTAPAVAMGSVARKVRRRTGFSLKRVQDEVLVSFRDLNQEIDDEV
jgi:hypothetical protein